MKVKVAQLCLTLWTPWTVARQASLSMEFFRQQYWSGLPFSPPGDLPDPGLEPQSPALAVGFFTYSAITEVPLDGELHAKGTLSAFTTSPFHHHCTLST